MRRKNKFISSHGDFEKCQSLRGRKDKLLARCRLAHHFLLGRRVCHNTKVVAKSPIDQHALMTVQTTSNSGFIRAPFEAPEQTSLA